MGVITHVRPLTFGTYLSDSLQPGLGPVDPTSHHASHSGPAPLADTMVRVPHGSWRDDDAARVVRSSFQLDVHRSEFETSLYATWSALTSLSRPYRRTSVYRADLRSNRRRAARPLGDRKPSLVEPRRIGCRLHTPAHSPRRRRAGTAQACQTGAARPGQRAVERVGAVRLGSRLGGAGRGGRWWVGAPTRRLRRRNGPSESGSAPSADSANGPATSLRAGRLGPSGAPARPIRTLAGPRPPDTVQHRVSPDPPNFLPRQCRTANPAVGLHTGRKPVATRTYYLSPALGAQPAALDPRSPSPPLRTGASKAGA
jgi:hypothetical protein